MTADAEHADCAERRQNIDRRHKVAANLRGLHRLGINIVGFF